MDSSKLAIAFEPMGDDAELQSSPTSRLVVTENLSEVYYKGLPSRPLLIATTNPSPYDYPTGPEAYAVLKELRELGDHPLASVWDHGLADRLRSGLNTMCVNWTSIDAVRMVKEGQSSGPAIVWIGVEFGALTFKEGSDVAFNCLSFINSYGFRDYHVEIRESRVMRQEGNRFFDTVRWSDPTFAVRDPYTATLGIPISTKNKPLAEGTGGFYLSAGGDDKDIYLVTARHVVLPVDKSENREYQHRNNSRAHEDVTILGTTGFNKKLATIDKKIRYEEFMITYSRERIELVKDKDDHTSIIEHEKAEKNLQRAETKMKALRDFRREIATHWRPEEKRVFGELAWAPPITYSTEPGEYTLDLAVIKINAGKLDADNYHGNTINIGDKYKHWEFMEKIYQHPTSSKSFEFPVDRLVTLQGQVPETVLVNLPVLDTNSEPCLVVFKNGANTGTTIGKTNNVSSYTRIYVAGEYLESREWPIIPTDKNSAPFSRKGDSGSCVADSFGRIGGILTSSCGATDYSDLTYVTPISFIMKVLHRTKIFKYAHLNPILA
ncbi:uncharacterized protein BT62DRAFT_730250 [Guyanagaster necrorhizus]|uniref:Uncharacterized protein n=1 Tax=Guyanagaster necrorhizus TaxID=856835 RepID=A0A9P8AUU5_9AGAR|nr:uncharacterized protein BT62DRAFT_730250 [Guyanagaster necrorhizus MCA 3950]KAG7448833.1 hypothetical protein BT62DRAFT_730250 [Guyanagaster necrorhizus MCA 3950]